MDRAHRVRIHALSRKAGRVQSLDFLEGQAGGDTAGSIRVRRGGSVRADWRGDSGSAWPYAAVVGP